MDDSLFISDTVHEKTIKGGNGKPITVWLKELPNTSYIRMQQALNSGDPEAKAAAVVRIVSESVVEPSGEPSMDFAKAQRLKVPVLDQLFTHVMSLSKDEDVGNASPPEEKNGFGTSSPSA